MPKISASIAHLVAMGFDEVTLRKTGLEKGWFAYGNFTRITNVMSRPFLRHWNREDFGAGLGTFPIHGIMYLRVVDARLAIPCFSARHIAKHSRWLLHPDGITSVP